MSLRRKKQPERTGEPAVFRVPLMPVPPAWVGTVQASDYAVAAGFDGLGAGGTMDARRAQVFVAATKTHLCVAIVSELHPEKDFLPGDAIEVDIDPQPAARHGAVHRLRVDPQGGIRRILQRRGIAGGAPKALRFVGAQVASSVRDHLWHCRILLAAAAFGRADTTSAPWSLNVCRLFHGPEVRAALCDDVCAPGGLRFMFTEGPCAAVYMKHEFDPFGGDVRWRLSAFNPGPAPVELNARFLCRPPRRPEIAQDAALRLAAGEQQSVIFKIEALASQFFELSALVTNGEGEAVHSCSGKYVRGGPRWTPPEVMPLPIDFRFAYYPYLDRMRIRAEALGLPEDARLRQIDFAIVRLGGGETIHAFSLHARQFSSGVCETDFELPPLEGQFEIIARGVGKNVPAEPRAKYFERRRFEWEHNNLGRSHTVYPPFTPIEVEGNTLRTVLKEYEMNRLGLLDRVRTEHSEGLDTEEILDGPMRYTATVDGKRVVGRPGTFTFERVEKDCVVARSAFAVGPIAAESVATLDYDGTLRIDLTLLPCEGRRVEELDLEIPLRGQVARMVHGINGRFRDAVEFRNLPEGQGVVWSAADIPPTGWEENFCSYVFLGNPSRGLCWFTANSRGWSRDLNTPCLDVVRRGGRVTLRVHLVNVSLEIKEPRQITFGLQAAPVKPRLKGWRHRWYTDSFSVLGCDSHWFSLGNYACFYPAGCDLSLWETLRRANQERLSDAEIDAFIERGRKNFEPYGPNTVRLFENMAQLNLRNRHGKQMIFYYNRDMTPGADECQTFVDEWHMEEYNDALHRRPPRGAPGGAMGIGPSESFMDFSLYWYAKSFELGGNTGVYMDNIYYRPFRSLVMSDAYRREDGTVVPSNGIWQLREQARRTFQFLCERGMEPIQMAHMTSLAILPILSFYTVQYDWEWQRGRGDVHDRFTRQYLQLVSSGELAGTWPIVLHELGEQDEGMASRYDYAELRRLWDEMEHRSENPWIIKTFLGVTIVHELIVDPYRWHYEPVPPGDSAENRLFQTFRQPILDFARQDGVDVYRYWDARPQPVKATDPDLPGIVFVRKGRAAIAAVTSYAAENRQAEVFIDARALGFKGGCRVVDMETGAELPVARGRVRFPLKKHDLRMFRIEPSGAPRPAVSHHSAAKDKRT